MSERQEVFHRWIQNRGSTLSILDFREREGVAARDPIVGHLLLLDGSGSRTGPVPGQSPRRGRRQGKATMFCLGGSRAVDRERRCGDTRPCRPSNGHNLTSSPSEMGPHRAGRAPPRRVASCTQRWLSFRSMTARPPHRGGNSAFARSCGSIEAGEITLSQHQIDKQRGGLPEESVLFGEFAQTGQHVGETDQVGVLHGSASVPWEAIA